MRTVLFICFSVIWYSINAFDCDSALLKYRGRINLGFNDRKVELYHLLYFANRTGKTVDKANVLRHLGSLYKNNGQLDSAVLKYLLAIDNAKQGGHLLSLASCYNQMGIIYTELNNDSLAIKYFVDAHNNYLAVNDYRGVADAGMNISQRYFEDSNLVLSEYFCLKSMQSRRTWGDTSGIGYSYNLLSQINLNKNNLKLAFNYSNLAIGLFEEANDVSGLLPGLIQCGSCFEKSGRMDSANFYYKECLLIAKRQQYKKWITAAAKCLVGTYERLKQPDSVNVYLKVYSAYKDSLFEENIIETTIREAARYETEKIETNLKNEKLLSAKMTQQLYILAGLILVLIITIVLMVRNFRQRKKIQEKQSELNNANAMIEGQDAERERIARELHDRVGSMLSTVKLQVTSMDEQMSSLILQHGESYKKVIHLLDDTYDEVRRISHDLDSGLLSRFGFKTAMMQLVQLLESTNKLKVMYIDNGVDPSVYKAFETDLYRITQELLSNAIKYASAKEISLQLSINNGNLLFSYEDDGVGFDKATLDEKKGIGYKNIVTRVKKMKGTWHLDTSLGHGTNLIIEIPLNAKI